MKFTTFATTCLSFSLVKGQFASPSYVETEADLVERELNIPSLISDLLDGFNVADFISDIDSEKIAGWANNLLTEDDHEKYLNDVLVGLKNTNILPDGAVYIVTHNTTLKILEEALPTVLKVVNKVNTTSLFDALDRSGLAYSVVAGCLENSEFLPSLLEIVKKLISTGDIDLSSLLQQAENLVEGNTKRNFAPGNFVSGIEKLPVLEKRDNIEDLLTTVFSAIGQSGLLNETVITLLTNDEFQDATVVLIQGAFQNIGSLIDDVKGANFTALQPILTSLKQSNLLQNTLERALKDQALRQALTSDLASLLKEGGIKETDLVSEADKQQILSMDSSLEAASSFAISSTVSSLTEAPSSATSTSSSSSSESSSSLGSGSSHGSLLSLMFLLPLGLISL